MSHDLLCEAEYTPGGRVFIGCLCRIRAAKAEAWDEGFDAAYNEARNWGHVDHWEGWPDNPHRVLPAGVSDD